MMRDLFFYFVGLSTLPTLFMLLCVFIVAKEVAIRVRQERLKRKAALYPLIKDEPEKWVTTHKSDGTWSERPQ